MPALALILSVVLLVGMYFMPKTKTPRWLVNHGRDDARDVLRQNRYEEAVEKEIRDIKSVEREEEGGLEELTSRWVRPALLVAIGLAVFQQIIGINTIIYYSPTTLTQVGYTDLQAICGQAVISLINVLMTLVAIRFVARLGRKALLLIGLVGMVLSLSVLGLFSLLLPQPSNPSDALAIITLVCLASFIISSAATCGPTVWMMLPDVLPLRIRGIAMGVANFCTGSRTSPSPRRFPPWYRL